MVDAPPKPHTNPRAPLLSYRWLVALVAAALGALAVAATLPTPRLLVPLFVAGLTAAGAVLEALRLVLVRLVGPRAPAGLALLCGLGALALHGVAAQLAPPVVEGPEPVRLVLLFVTMLEAACAVAGVFVALDAASDKGAAWLGLSLCLVALFFIGQRGAGSMPARTGAATAAITAATLLVARIVGALVRYRTAQRK